MISLPYLIVRPTIVTCAYKEPEPGEERRRDESWELGGEDAGEEGGGGEGRKGRGGGLTGVAGWIDTLVGPTGLVLAVAGYETAL